MEENKFETNDFVTENDFLINDDRIIDQLPKDALEEQTLMTGMIAGKLPEKNLILTPKRRLEKYTF